MMANFHGADKLLSRIFMATLTTGAGVAHSEPDYGVFTGQYACGKGANGQPMARIFLDGETGSLRVQGLAGNETAGIATRGYAPSEGYLRYTLMMNQRDMVIVRFDMRSRAKGPDLLMPGPLARLACAKEG